MHTSGPWTAAKVANNYDQWMIHEERTGRTIAMGIEGHDNAALFVAAPELLELLDEIVNCGYLFDDRGKYPREAGLACRIRKAIAKAEERG